MTGLRSEKMIKRSVVVAGHRTSVSLEDAFWYALREYAAARTLSVNDLVTEIDKTRVRSLSGSLRMYVLAVARQSSTGLGGVPAGPF